MTTKINKNKGFSHVLVITILVATLLFALGWIFWQNFIFNDQPKVQVTDSNKQESKKTEENKSITDGTEVKSEDLLEGRNINTGPFKISVLNGWKNISASNGTKNGDIEGVVFKGPNGDFSTLVYSKDKAPKINFYDHLPLGWDGYTQHFYVVGEDKTRENYSQYDYDEDATVTDFSLNSGLDGKKIVSVIKPSDVSEDSIYGKPKEDYYRVNYEFVKDNTVVRANYTYFKSSNIDIDRFEEVIKTIDIN